MSEVSRTWRQLTLPGMDSDISSQELVDGAKPCGWPTGGSEAFGPVPVRANRTRRQGSGKATRTIGTCGQTSTASSESVALTRSLVSRCQELLSTAGSIEYTQTWKEKATPSGIAYWEHTASARRTSDSDCTGWLPETDPPHLMGWPTPKAQEDGRTLEQYEAARQRGYETRKGKTSGGPASAQGGLAIAAQLTGWPTPAVQNASGGPNPLGNTGEHFTLQTAAVLAGWSTPSATVWGGTAEQHLERKAKAIEAGSKMGLVVSNLQCQAQLAGWVSPTAQDGERGTNPPRPTDTGVPLSQQVAGLGATTESSSVETGKPVAYQLNANFSRWLMGYRPEWSSCVDTAMRSFPKSRRSLSKRSSKRKGGE